MRSGGDWFLDAIDDLGGEECGEVAEEEEAERV